MSAYVVTKWRKSFLWSWSMQECQAELQKNSGDEATYTFVFGCCMLRELGFWRWRSFWRVESSLQWDSDLWNYCPLEEDYLIAGWLWYMSNLTARFEWWIIVRPKRLPVPCTWEVEEDYIDILVNILVLPVGQALSWSCSQKSWNSVMFPHISKFTLK